MMSRSSSSKGLARDGVRRSLWAVVLSTLAFVVSMLLPSLMNMQQALEDRKGMIVDGARASELAQSWKYSLADAASYIGGENALVKLAVILLAVVAGTAMFAYLHDKRKVDFYHSLPISREKLYLVNFVTGAVCVIAPYLVLRVLTLVCAHAMGFGEAVSVGTYLGVILCDILFFLLLYAMSALSTILCGNTIIALLFQLWVYLAPLAIQMMHEGLLSLYCKTYASMSYSDLFNHLRLSPAATYFMVNGAHYGSGLADNFIRAGKPAYMLLAEYAAAALFIIASLTDMLDGKIARKYNLVTNFGKFMDPLADKLLVCSALICLIELGQLPSWMVIIIVSREFIISGFRLIAAEQGIVIAASYWGKFKTTFQMIAVILMIVDLPVLHILTVACTWIALVLTVVSLVDYIAKNHKVLTEGAI